MTTPADQQRRIVKAIGSRELIVAAGMARSGSTLLYNMIRLCLEQAGKNVSAAWIEDFSAEGIGDADCVIIKVHLAAPALRGRANRILTCHRDLRDIVRSIRDMGWVPSHEHAATKSLPRNIRAHGFWAAKAGLDLKYEVMIADTPAAVEAVNDALGLPPLGDHAGRIAAAVERLEEPATSQTYDGLTLIHPRHRFGGKPGSWREALEPALISRIEAEHGAWLTDHGYTLSNQA